MKHPVAAILALVTVLWTASACEPQPPEDIAVTTAKEDTGVVWPEGSAEQGRKTFIDLGCNSCHRVEGVEDLPKPSASPEVPVVLGGENIRRKWDTEVLTAIVNPSHDLAEGTDPAEVASGGKSRMGDYARVMTVEQLVDIVAFLRSTEVKTSVKSP